MSLLVRPLRRSLPPRRAARAAQRRQPSGRAGLPAAPISSGFRYPVHRTALGPLRPILLLILVGATVVAALLWSAGEQMLAQARTDAVTAASRENANRAIAYREYVARTLDSARLAIDHFADRFATLAPAPGPAASPRLLDDPIARNRLFASVAVLDARGVVRWASVPGLPPLDLARHPDFGRLRDDRSDRVSISYGDSPAGIRRIVSRRPLADYGLFVTSGIAERDVLAAEQGRAVRVRGMTTAITLAIALFAGLAIHALLHRDKAARDLAGTNDRLHEAQRIGGIGDWEYDRAGDRLVLSDQICRMYDRAPDDDMIGGRAALALLPPADRRRLLAAVRRAIAGKRPQSCDVLARTGRRRRTHRRIRIVPIVEADGSVRSLIGTEQDVSAEKTHAALREEIAHGARVQAMNIMAATIAHEIAQPLTAAANYIAAAQLAAQAGAPAPHADRLDKARAQIALAHGIMQQARDLAANRRAGGAARVAEAVDDALALLHAATPGCRTQIGVALDPEAAWVAADKVQVQQVLLNLLRNAVQALGSHPEGRIVVASAAQPDGMALLTVTDNGPGIGAPEAIFSPFVSSRPASGLGIGLSICRTIVESYGGRIYAEPGMAQGARLCFTLPALAAPGLA